jgi:nucleoside-diphosphate-sugar epimerase
MMRDFASNVPLQEFRQLVSPHKRVLILGASGWFGQTAATMFAESQADLVCVVRGHAKNSLRVPRANYIEWDERRISEFRPTLILDFSFLTRDYEQRMSPKDFATVNQGLTKRLLTLFQSDYVRSVIYVSSGAAAYPTNADNRSMLQSSYGSLKREAEERLLAAWDGGRQGKKLTILRAWNVTGPYILSPTKYLFTSLISQALNGHIRVDSEIEVWRKFVSISDALTLSLWNLNHSVQPVLETGGELIEARQLARRVREIVNPNSGLEFSSPSNSERDDYFPTGFSWQTAVNAAAFEPMNLADQIRVTSEYLRRQL